MLSSLRPAGLRYLGQRQLATRRCSRNERRQQSQFRLAARALMLTAAATTKVKYGRGGSVGDRGGRGGRELRRDRQARRSLRSGLASLPAADVHAAKGPARRAHDGLRPPCGQTGTQRHHRFIRRAQGGCDVGHHDTLAAVRRRGPGAEVGPMTTASTASSRSAGSLGAVLCRARGAPGLVDQLQQAQAARKQGLVLVQVHGE